MQYNCKIGKVTPKSPQLKVVYDEGSFGYKSDPEVVSFVRGFFDVLQNEDVRSVAVIFETDEGTGSNFIITPGATYSTLISLCDILKHKLIESYVS